MFGCNKVPTTKESLTWKVIASGEGVGIYMYILFYVKELLNKYPNTDKSIWKGGVGQIFSVDLER